MPPTNESKDGDTSCNMNLKNKREYVHSTSAARSIFLGQYESIVPYLFTSFLEFFTKNLQNMLLQQPIKQK
jgi:hypothetical protein